MPEEHKNKEMIISSKTIEDIEKLAEKDNPKKIEAILFVAGKFLNMAELVSLSDLNPIIIREVMENLKKKYTGDDSVIRIIEKGEAEKTMWKMDVAHEHSYITSRIATGSSEFTKAEQGTLAIVAFKQPIKQSVVIKIRGNKAYDHIKRFNELGLVKKKKTGHTYELSLADDFYDYFNVSESDIVNVPERDIGNIPEREIKETRLNDSGLSEKTG